MNKSDLELCVGVTLRAKFSENDFLEEQLYQTENHFLEESNYWHNKYWGVCYCKKCNGIGENKLGEIIMNIRASLYEGE